MWKVYRRRNTAKKKEKTNFTKKLDPAENGRTQLFYILRRTNNIRNLFRFVCRTQLFKIGSGCVPRSLIIRRHLCRDKLIRRVERDMILLPITINSFGDQLGG